LLFVEAVSNNESSQAGAVLTKSEAAEFLRIKTRTLDEWMRLKRVPYAKLPSGTVRFRRDQLLQFIGKFEVMA
jgi:excisionase family DNA binding protein